MANKSIRDRIKVTKNGKVKRRAQGLGHNRSKWNSKQKQRKLGKKDVDLDKSQVSKLLSE
ncbi:MAG TPA: bL35 family ribosomal protein [Candidatus Paceibacterota bacterium]|nr:bL35 family ribosomal protein [Candidatus Paceibacterota bacterium]